MKKQVLVTVILFCMISFCSCASKPKALDLEVSKTAIDQTRIFDMAMQNLNSELLETYHIDGKLIRNHMIMVAVLPAEASLCIVALPQQRAETELKTQLDAFIKNYETLWSTRRDDLPDQYDLVKNRMETTLATKEGTYFVYIVSPDNETTLNAIRSGFVY